MTMDDLGMLGGTPNIVNIFNQYYGLDPDTNPYLNCTVSDHYDLLEICTNNLYKEKPIFLSMNIQSLNSKLNDLKQFLFELEKNNVKVIAVALQEIWQIQHSDLMQIPTLTLYFCSAIIKGAEESVFMSTKVYHFKRWRT
jgi:hypothetical protein